jgi:FkbM family methyltransferase
LVEGLNTRLRSVAKRVLPSPVVRAVHAARVARERRRHRTVSHTYGGHPFEITIGSRYGERYDREWPKLAEIELLRRGALTAGARVFNIGANHGVVALMLARAVEPGGTVIAVEANPYDADLATRNVKRNAQNVSVVHAAVAEASGSLAFGLDGAVAAARRRVASRQVRGVTIDELSERFGSPDVVFMDIEGFELAALEGATQTLRAATDWFVEVHGLEELARFEGSAAKVLAFFPSERFERWVARDGLSITASGQLVELTRFKRFDHGAEPPEGRFFLVAFGRP